MAKKSKDKISNENIQHLIQLHVSEYEAIMTRTTYISTMLYTLSPALLLFFGLIAQTWQFFDHGKLIWGCVFAFELVTVAWYAICLESYNNVRYLEKHLRPSVSRLLGDNQFWMYESYQKQLRGNSILWFEHYTAILSFIAIAIASLIRFTKWNPFDWYSIVACGIILVLIIFLDVQLVKIRHDFFEPPNQALKLTE